MADELPWIQRAALRITRTDLFRRLIGPKVMGKIDRRVLVRTKGRYTALGPPMFPTMVLNTTGAKSGEPRPVALVYAPDGDDCYVVASNWARENHPAWSANLIAHPDVDVIADGREWAARARLLDADEKAARWPSLIEVMPQWDAYTEITDRDLRVFVLEPV